MLDALKGPSAEEKLQELQRIKADVAYENGLIKKEQYHIELEKIGIPIFPTPQEDQPLIESIRERATTLLGRLHALKPTTVFSRTEQSE
jgi:hypothetical protein